MTDDADLPEPLASDGAVVINDPQYWAEHLDELVEALCCATRPEKFWDEPEDGFVRLRLMPDKYRESHPAIARGAPKQGKRWKPRDALLRVRRTSPDGPPERLTLTVEEAAQILGISRAFAYEAANSGQIPVIRIGRRILVPKAALERFLAGDAPQSQP